LGLAFQAKYEEAIRAFDAAIGINPKCAKPWKAKSYSLKALCHAFEADVAFAMASGLG
jgi:hypothetical protein